jgi:hypothetical protein
MLGILSMGKLIFWGIVFISPRWRDQAEKELSSNADVLKLCWNLG